MIRPEGGYKIIGIAGSRVIERRRQPKAPSNEQMVQWGLRHDVKFVARYMPSKKGWRVIDIRSAFNMAPITLQTGQTVPRIAGHRVLSTIYPSEDALVMHLMTVIDGTQLKLL